VKKKLSFNELSLTDKALIMAEFGDYLESIEYYDYWIHLYSLQNQFVEIYYNCRSRQIEKMLMLEYKDLDKYLNRIVIDKVIK
jgi:hypothetical protein